MKYSELKKLCAEAQQLLRKHGAMEDLLYRMHLPIVKRHERGFLIECPIHKSQSGNGDLSIYYQAAGPVYWAWKCYSQGCDCGSTDIVSFVAYTMAISRESAAKFILSAKVSATPPKMSGPAPKKRQPSVKPVRQSAFVPSPTWHSRGISLDTLTRFKVEDDQHYTRVPVHYPDQKLAGYCLRIIYPKCEKPHCGKHHPPGGVCSSWNKHLSPDFEKSKCLFNWHRVQPFLSVNSTIVVVESITDCLMVEQTGLHRCVALMGCAVSPLHLELLGQIRNVVVATDTDDDGDGVYEKLLYDLPDTTRVARFEPLVKYFANPDQCSTEQIAKDVAEAKHLRSQLDAFGRSHRIPLY